MLSRQLMINLILKRSAYKRVPVLNPDLIYIKSEFLKITVEHASIQSAEDWKKLRQHILDNCDSRSLITPTTVDAMTLGVCTVLEKYDLAFKYFDYLQKEIPKPNLAAIGKYLRALYLKGLSRDLTADDKNRILTIYDHLKKLYPVMNSTTLDNLTQAISFTDRWRDGLDLCKSIKITTPIPSTAYSALIAAAFRNNDEDLAWKLFDELLENEKGALPTVYITYFNKLIHVKDMQERRESINKMFNYLQKNQVKIINDCEDIAKSLRKVCSLVKIVESPDNRGKCPECKTKLDKFELAAEDFDTLKSRIFKRVIIGKDVFNRSTPEEVQQFKNFIDEMDSFDVVVDGLNVSYAKGLNTSMKTKLSLLVAVVTHFSKMGKKVLVLGRSHMQNWCKTNWAIILKNATVFLTEDLSYDDPYLLYCALNSGNQTIIVTRDLMRSHKALLANLQEKLMFERWLAQSQYSLIRVNNYGVPVFQFPLPFSHIAQKKGSFWHVPIDPVNAQDPVKWLCVRM